MLFGGRTGDVCSNRVYVQEGSGLTELPRMSSERCNFGICYHEDHVYVAGGIERDTVRKF